MEIIGEAVYRLRRDHPERCEQIADAHKLIGLRNVLAHGYDAIDYAILWDAAVNKLPILQLEIINLSNH